MVGIQFNPVFWAGLTMYFLNLYYYTDCEYFKLNIFIPHIYLYIHICLT